MTELDVRALIMDSGPFSCQTGWSDNLLPSSDIGHVISESFEQPSDKRTVQKMHNNR